MRHTLFPNIEFPEEKKLYPLDALILCATNPKVKSFPAVTSSLVILPLIQRGRALVSAWQSTTIFPTSFSFLIWLLSKAVLALLWEVRSTFGPLVQFPSPAIVGGNLDAKCEHYETQIHPRRSPCNPPESLVTTGWPLSCPVICSLVMFDTIIIINIHVFYIDY